MLFWSFPFAPLRLICRDQQNEVTKEGLIVRWNEINYRTTIMSLTYAMQQGTMVPRRVAQQVIFLPRYFGVTRSALGARCFRHDFGTGSMALLCHSPVRTSLHRLTEKCCKKKGGRLTMRENESAGRESAHVTIQATRKGLQTNYEASFVLEHAWTRTRWARIQGRPNRRKDAAE